MNKSVYSLVLLDDVVEQIDRVAYEMNTSRSNMINQILAEYVSYTTPEKRMREIFSAVEQQLTGSNTFQVLLQPSESMFSFRSALAYKYNPTIRYSVELYRNRKPLLGELRVSLRSQNSTLLLYLLQFFKLWVRVEEAYLGRTESTVEDGRFLRTLVLRGGTGDADNEAVGEAIAAYIDLFDRSLKTYFANLDDPQRAVMLIRRLYAEYLGGRRFVV